MMTQTLESFLWPLAALAVVLGLVLLAARLAPRARFTRWRSSFPTERRLRVQETLLLDRARRILIVQCDGREVMLLTGGGADLVVGWLPQAGEVS